MTGIVSDATALIILAKLERLDLLKSLFSSVVIPSLVYAEINAKDDYDNTVWEDGFFCIKDGTTDELCRSLRAILDPRESEAVALAAAFNLPLLIDEKKGRNVARSLGIQVIGIVGILLALKQKGHLDKSAILSLLDDALRIGFRLSVPLYTDFCKCLDD